MGIDLFGSLPLVVIWLALGGVGIVIQAFVRDNTRLVFGYYISTLIATGVLAAITFGHTGLTFDGMVTMGGSGAYFDILFCVTGVLTMLAARPYLQREEAEIDEFYTLLVSAVSGMMLMAHANNLVVLFVGIELMSISFYVMAGFFRKSIRSIEAALKYFLLGAFATGFLVYGMALVYGSTNALDYATITSVVRAGTTPFPMLLAAGVTLMAVGLCFKIAAFPFHQWAPDVYQGSPTVVSAFMSTAGKAAAFSAFIPAFTMLMPVGAGAAYALNMQLALAVIAAVTMLVGNISAIAQSNVKRMLAFSSVAHAGYLLMGIVSGTAAGHQAIIFYLTAYTFMQLGAFVIVSILERENDTHLEYADYAGLSRTHPVLAFVMAMFMFSLAGIPPFAGFLGKHMLFAAAIDSGFTWLTIIAVISSVISVYFYLGLVVKMYFAEPVGEVHHINPGTAALTLGVAAAFTVLLGVLPSVLQSMFTTFH